MKIALIAPLIERVPPKKYGGTERVIYGLAEELVKRGHEVTLFASGDSKTSAKLISVIPKSLREAKAKDLYGFNVHTVFNLGLAYNKQAEFDIIHDHTGYIGLPLANIATTPTVVTMHGAFDFEMRSIYQHLNKPHVVTISKAQARNVFGINIIDTVYNGLAMEKFPFIENNEDYLLYVGRISMEKGVHFAVQAANYLHMSLIIAAKLEKADIPYFNEYVAPYLSESVRWIGEVDEEERNKLMSKAKAFLHPVTWPEPFGLTLIEAMACGCPVIAFDKGSIPEVIDNGKTGFVVSNLEEMVDAIGHIETIDRKACRNHALKNFSVKRMADGYEQVYYKILSKEKKEAYAFNEELMELPETLN